MKKPIKKVAAWLLVTILMLQNTMLTAKGADYGTDETVRTPGIYRDGRYLKDQDTVREQDVLEWVTEVSFSGESEEIEIPEGLLYFSKARSLITLAGPDGTVRAKTSLSEDQRILTVENPDYEKKERQKKSDEKLMNSDIITPPDNLFPSDNISPTESQEPGNAEDDGSSESASGNSQENPGNENSSGNSQENPGNENTSGNSQENPGNENTSDNSQENPGNESTSGNSQEKPGNENTSDNSQENPGNENTSGNSQENPGNESSSGGIMDNNDSQTISGYSNSASIHTHPALQASISPRGRHLLTSAEKDAPLGTDSQAAKIKQEDDENIQKTEESDTWEWDYILTVPCTIDTEQAAEDGTINIEGLSIRIAGNDADGTALNELKSQLYKEDSDGGVGERITGNSAVSLNTPLWLKMSIPSLKDMDAGTTYLITLPDALSPVDDGSMSLEKVLDGISSTTFGEVVWTSGSTVLEVTFIDFGPIAVSGGTITYKDLRDVEIYYSCKLNHDNLDTDDKGIVTISLPGGTEVSFTISERVPQPPKLEKDGTWDADGTIHWKITYTQPVKGYIEDNQDSIPKIIRDRIPSELEYADGTARAAAHLNTVSVPQYDKDTQILTCDISSLPPGETVEITYDTILKDNTLSNIWARPGGGLSFTNQAEALDENGVSVNPSIQAAKTVQVPSDWPGRNMIAKHGRTIEPQADGDQWKINWTVTVNTVSRDFEHLYVIDEMGKGLELDKDSILINGINADDISTIDKIITADPVSAKTMLEIKLIENSTPKTAEAVYTITYTTAIDQDYFDQNNQNSQAGQGLTAEDLSNKVSLDYAWPDGSGPGSDRMPPSVSKGPGDLNINNNLILKSARAYDKSAHTITWTVTVNPNKVNMTSIHLTDELITPPAPGEYRHVFVPGASTEEVEANKDDCLDAICAAIEKGLEQAGITGANPDCFNRNNVSLDSVQGQSGNPSPVLALDLLDIRLGDIGKNSFDFTLTSYVDDPDFWASNKNETFHNTVTMKRDGTTVENTPIRQDRTAAAQYACTSNVLKKSHISYSPDTRELTWKLTVNENQAPLGDVAITDDLPEGLSCTADNVKNAMLDNTAFPQGENTGQDTGTDAGSQAGQKAGITVGPDDSGSPNKRILIRLKDVKQAHTITIPVTVDINNTYFRNSREVSVENRAVLSAAANPGKTVEAVSKMVLENEILNKKDISHAGNTVNYQVSVNPLGVSLTGGYPDMDLYVNDTLDAGLYIDLESVKLYEALPSQRVTPDSSGHYRTGLTMGNDVTPPLDQIYYNAKENSFSVPIPDAEGSYILTYSAYVVRSGVKLNNAVKLVGSIIPEDSGNSGSSAAFTQKSFGTAGFSLPSEKFLSIQVRKVDGEQRILKGAVFGLYSDRSEDALLVSAPCDDNTGICTLAVPRSQIGNLDRIYYKEIKAPEHYALNDQWNEIKTDAIKDEVLTFTNLPSEDGAAGAILVKKMDADSSVALKDAVFCLYTDPSCAMPAGEASVTGEDGTAVFTGLYPGRTYWLKEEEAPAGYVKTDRVTETVAVKNLPAAVEIYNERAKAALTILKTDRKTGLPLKGVKLQLFYDPACTIPAGDAAETDENGMHTFTGLQPRTAYYIMEIQPAEGYLPDLSVYSAATGENTETDASGHVAMESSRPEPPPAPEDGDNPSDTPENNSQDSGRPHGSGSSGSGSSGHTAGQGAAQTDYAGPGPGAQTQAGPAVTPEQDQAPGHGPNSAMSDDTDSSPVPLPRTGENNNTVMWRCLAAASLMGMLFLMADPKRRN